MLSRAAHNSPLLQHHSLDVKHSILSRRKTGARVNTLQYTQLHRGKRGYCTLIDISRLILRWRHSDTHRIPPMQQCLISYLTSISRPQTLGARLNTLYSTTVKKKRVHSTTLLALFCIINNLLRVASRPCSNGSNS